ncbi:glycosyltransferase family 4 protein [Cupriavidus gilardii]|uniref:glycosyltransferase family 4 protein n=2 Tax=Cupriavidus gilardii TaxID=82541 RepID=UPI001EE6167A|nr:glycosyltransferase family 4 protein [Cupriavidus gilardii]MCG5260316.1 glycosyltransferase family 4 protein [Cupriavidus gilardii]MDF9432376.1 glycosyltransferase family 4 protein [Cupriavidus gilardii]
MTGRQGRPTVCFLTGTLNAFAGAERMTAVIANELARRGYAVHIVSLWDAASCFELEPTVRHEALFAQRPSFKRRYVDTVLGIRRYVKRHRIDVLIEVDTMLTLFTLPACVGLPIRRIAWEHCNFDQDLGRRARRIARRLAARNCEHVVVLTDRDRRKWEAALRCRNIVVIPNALPLAMPVEPAPVTSKIALAVGRLTHAKGFDVLLHAWALVHRQCPDWRLDIVGDGELRDELVNQRDALGLQHCVRLLPARKELEPLYRQASLFCLPSRYEGFGLVLLEAMAFGLPVVSTDCETGPRELLTGRDVAIVVRPDDAAAFGTAICSLIREPNRAMAIGQAGRAFAARYEAPAIGRQWETLLAGPEGNGETVRPASSI